MNARLPLAVATLMAAAFAAACASGTGTTGTGTGTGTKQDGRSVRPAGGATSGSGAKAADVSCALAPASLVNSSLGVSMREPTVKKVVSIVTVCSYAPTSGSGGVTVRFQTNEDAAGFARAKAGFKDSGQPTSDISGFFDQAFSSALGSTSPINTIVVRKGSVEILVTSHASIAKEKRLVSKIFAAMG